MANCNNLFIEFNKEIRLTDKRRKKLRKRRNDLRKRIQSGYNIIKSSGETRHDITFQSQGSYVMDTIINPENKDCEYDLDDGLYFFGQLSKHQRPKAQTFHNWVIRAIEQGKSDRNYEEIKDKPPCVRVHFRSPGNDFNYHVDIPIYYAREIHRPELAHLNEEWPESNPVAFIIWFEEKTESGFKQEFILEREKFYGEYKDWLNDIRKKDHQLRRIVRYLKAWGDHIDNDMPPGIAMTILAGRNYCPADRDDESMTLTLEEIARFLENNGFQCPRPTSPVGEDLFASYNQEQKNFFKERLDAFIESAKEAMAAENQKEACRKWKEHLGKRFPCQLAKDKMEGSDTQSNPVIINSSRDKSA
ncbi:CBASS cGAMP synthase [Christiangramia sp. ASW11-125]|uniref:CBASS cGAMP synthase n=1 Tax=Christiangramia TaxID=292691 RepID=UPI00040DAC2A|nr:hypothetical protein [Christiangramia portivictoriae]